jgi:hypothetical protein
LSFKPSWIQADKGEIRELHYEKLRIPTMAFPHYPFARECELSEHGVLRVWCCAEELKMEDLRQQQKGGREDADTGEGGVGVPLVGLTAIGMMDWKVH